MEKMTVELTSVPIPEAGKLTLIISVVEPDGAVHGVDAEIPRDLFAADHARFDVEILQPACCELRRLL